VTIGPTIRDRTAIVGVGATPYYRRGRSAPQTLNELVCKAIIAAANDAGLKVADIDGFAYFAGGFDTPYLMETLGIPETTFTACLTGSGGGSAGVVGLAAAAIVAGMAKTIVCVGGVQQTALRYGAMPTSYEADAENSFYQSTGLVGPGHMFALLARRHMHLYGTTRDQLADVAMTMRAHALGHPDALMQKPLTREEYFEAPMISDPHCLFDFCLESDGAAAVIVTSAERARDLQQRPVLVHASVHGGPRDWGRCIYWMNMPDETFASSGFEVIARRLYDASDIKSADIDTVQLYDHFTSQVIMQLEDFGFCEKGEGGPLVASGAIRHAGGLLPVNTDGGQLSGAYIWGMSHVREAALQLRGTAHNQVRDARSVLVTGGPSNVPVSALILRSDP
jgi:acetyl-CoA acetyltransferase